MSATDWLKETYAHFDARDVEAFLARVTDDVWLRFGNAHPLHGKHAARDALAELFERIGGSQHRLTRVWDEGDFVGLQADVEFARKDGASVQLPMFIAWRMRGDLGASCQVFGDFSPVFEDTEPPAICAGYAIDVVHEAGLESFPASDPPGWTSG